MKTAIALLLPCLLATAVFTIGITWGLPRAETNAYLFGQHPIWTGQQIIDLAGTWDVQSNLGADVDRNPLGDRSRVIELNDTDAKRAEIVRRYRLFSAQPDEMITFRALSQIQPGRLRFDPKLYQYGGLWTYVVGGLLQVAAICKLVTLRGDLAYYLDHPEAFAAFYIVARAYSAAWGVAGVCVIFAIARRLGANLGLASTAAVGFAVMPVVICAAHEAKPHLAGMVLVLATALAVMRFVERCSPRRWVISCVLAGAAAGMVPTAVVAILILPVALWLSRPPRSRVARHLLIAGAIVVGVYAITNPFVVVHLFYDRSVLASNAGNTGAMYGTHGWFDGVTNAARLIGSGAGPVIAIAGVIATVALFGSRRPPSGAMLPIVIAATVTAVLFAALGAGKPGEYGRFFALPDVTLWLAVIAALARLRIRPIAFGVAMLFALVTAAAGWTYLRACLRDSYHIGTRDQLAERFGKVSGLPMRVALRAEPAPYSMPAMDLFSTRWLLVPASVPDNAVDADWLVLPADELRSPPSGWDAAWSVTGGPVITWADKPFDVWRRVK